MITQAKLAVRPAVKEDRLRLTNLIHLEPYVHRHLDWRSPIEWLGSSPYLVAEKSDRIVAAMACPPDPPGIAWIQLFAASTHISPETAWKTFFPEILKSLENEDASTISAIPLQSWFEDILKKNKFRHPHTVMVLEHDTKLSDMPPPVKSLTIRDVTPDDLAEIYKIDEAAFGPMWRNSMASIETAFSQASLATLAADDNGILGYQISTLSPKGAHLARLAVKPGQQRRGIGYSLIYHLIESYSEKENSRVTVNTQDNNQLAIKLYNKGGFNKTGEKYPVYLYQIK